jgi:hypothetical protein
MVSIGRMNTQINLRLPEKMLVSAKKKADREGYGTVQEYIKEVLRTELFETISSKEIKLVRSLITLSEKNKLYGSEKDLFDKLKSNV